MAKTITNESFWDTDLETIESYSLNGRKVTDLPIRKVDGRVPNQGTVLMGRVRNIDHAVPMMNRGFAIIVRPFYKLGTFFK